MDKRYRNAFDQIHMSAACQARILAAASSAGTQEEQSAMKKSKNILKTMLLAAALAGCLSAVAYASNNLLPEHLSQLSHVVLSSDGSVQSVESYPAQVNKKADGSYTYVLDKNGAETKISINEPELNASNRKISVQESPSADGQTNLEVLIEDNAQTAKSASTETTENPALVERK